jgi:hypothetical protein
MVSFKPRLHSCVAATAATQPTVGEKITIIAFMSMAKIVVIFPLPHFHIHLIAFSGSLS